MSLYPSARERRAWAARRHHGHGPRPRALPRPALRRGGESLFSHGRSLLRLDDLAQSFLIGCRQVALVALVAPGVDREEVDRSFGGPVIVGIAHSYSIAVPLAGSTASPRVGLQEKRGPATVGAASAFLASSRAFFLRLRSRRLCSAATSSSTWSGWSRSKAARRASESSSSRVKSGLGIGPGSLPRPRFTDVRPPVAGAGLPPSNHDRPRPNIGEPGECHREIPSLLRSSQQVRSSRIQGCPASS